MKEIKMYKCDFCDYQTDDERECKKYEPHCCHNCMCFDECMEKQEDECDDEFEDSEAAYDEEEIDDDSDDE